MVARVQRGLRRKCAIIISLFPRQAADLHGLDGHSDRKMGRKIGAHGDSSPVVAAYQINLIRGGVVFSVRESSVARSAAAADSTLGSEPGNSARSRNHENLPPLEWHDGIRES